MYLFVVATLMFVLPLACLAGETIGGGASLGVAVVLKWFALWAVGVRLLLAGLRQIAQPRYTAHVLLGLKGDESLLLVRELGFANVATGLLGVGSFFQPAWRPAVALAGGVFYLLAGIAHALQPHRNRLENTAMVSDLWVGAILLACLAALAFA